MSGAVKYLARKPILLAGRRYESGQEVPMDSVLPERRRLLIEQRRVYSQATAAPTTRGRKRPKGK